LRVLEIGIDIDIEIEIEETCALFIRGVKITMHMKERLTRQFLDGEM
jgi:hypothetical protein